jgi:hypothetical protein
MNSGNPVLSDAPIRKVPSNRFLSGHSSICIDCTLKFLKPGGNAHLFTGPESIRESLRARRWRWFHDICPFNVCDLLTIDMLISSNEGIWPDAQTRKVR